MSNLICLKCPLMEMPLTDTSYIQHVYHMPKAQRQKFNYYQMLHRNNSSLRGTVSKALGEFSDHVQDLPSFSRTNDIYESHAEY